MAIERLIAPPAQRYHHRTWCCACSRECCWRQPRRSSAHGYCSPWSTGEIATSWTMLAERGLPWPHTQMRAHYTRRCTTVSPSVAPAHAAPDRAAGGGRENHRRRLSRGWQTARLCDNGGFARDGVRAAAEDDCPVPVAAALSTLVLTSPTGLDQLWHACRHVTATVPGTCSFSRAAGSRSGRDGVRGAAGRAGAGEQAARSVGGSRHHGVAGMDESTALSGLVPGGVPRVRLRGRGRIRRGQSGPHGGKPGWPRRRPASTAPWLSPVPRTSCCACLLNRLQAHGRWCPLRCWPGAAAPTVAGLWALALGCCVLVLLVVLTDIGAGWNQFVDLFVLTALWPGRSTRPNGGRAIPLH